MRILIQLAICIPLIANAQQNNGIKFEESLSWDQVKEKAKAQNKYIFVDCYTTWCGPCKMMDKKVYSNDTVGNYMNNKYISIKIQMDTSARDNEHVKKWHTIANFLRQQTKIPAYPAYLFFSPNGDMVHKDIGYKSPSNFVDLASIATDPNKQYYTLIENYRSGKMDFSEMPYLISMATALMDNELVSVIAQDYIDNYLLNLEEDTLYTKKNILFISNYINSSKAKYFALFSRESERIDAVMAKKGYSQKIVDQVIKNEEIIPVLTVASQTGEEPNWNKVYKIIQKNFSTEYAERNILTGKELWYKYNAEKYDKNWSEYIKYAIQKVEKYGTDTTDFWQDNYLNDIAWFGIFLHGNDIKQIGTGIKWMKNVIQRNPNQPGFKDTYANLLYKAGHTREAISLEEEVVKQDPQNAEFRTTLQKMQRGEPTWTIPEVKH
ncbi:DUF255 domain-containing protein [Chitinophaga agrisoli]|uniref:DUF255 domain-containing protein n=1 Tax=Chitinophaga agrisoli TaxID=2607653 RepID=A0A5B2VKR4_9BACT|nr:thioredoxin family protein [Chitinophaga agrisoli]KAA2238789.1 DUF255 domain-containing protein [Chitinophaga agrisoli]